MSIKVFVSYSHHDKDWLTEGTRKRLIPFFQQFFEDREVIFWYDLQLSQNNPGENYREIIRNEILNSQYALLLISNDFITSNFIKKFEILLIKQLFDEGRLKILPILIGPVDLKRQELFRWLADTQILPNINTPLTDCLDSERDWAGMKNMLASTLWNKFFPEERISSKNQSGNSKKEEHIAKRTLENIKGRKRFRPNLTRQITPIVNFIQQAFSNIVNANHSVPKVRQQSTIPPSRIDIVHFSISSPPSVQSGNQIIVNVWAHIEQQRDEVAKRVQQATDSTEAPPVIRPKGPFKINRGTILYCRLKFKDLFVEPDEDVIHWEGEISNASFVVSVPSDSPEEMKTGFVSVHCKEGLLIARIPIQIQIVHKAVQTEPIEHFFRPVRKAFVSYASADLDEVLSRIQGMQKILPDLEVFLDVIKLRSGEDWERRLWKVIPENDVFYLFWSNEAKNSTWVEKEWRCALSSRGMDFIDPVPLVSPKEVPPPEELESMHFNDWSLAYKRGK